MKYRVTVVFSYFDVIDVEADNKEDAMDIAWDSFDEKRMIKADGEVQSVIEIQEDVKWKSETYENEPRGSTNPMARSSSWGWVKPSDAVSTNKDVGIVTFGTSMILTTDSLHGGKWQMKE